MESDKQLAVISELVDNILEASIRVRDEPMPDWYNQHDYASGFFAGRKNGADITAVNMSAVKILLESYKNGKVSS